MTLHRTRTAIAAGTALLGVLATTPSAAVSGPAHDPNVTEREVPADVAGTVARDVVLLRHGTRALRALDGQNPTAPTQAVETWRPTPILNGADAVLTPLGVGASALGVSRAIDKLRDGDAVNGSLGLAGSTAGLLGSLAATSETFGITASLGVSVSLAPLAVAGAGAAATMEGVRDACRGVRESDVAHISSGSLKTVGGALMVGGAVTLDPLLAAGGSAVFLGGVVHGWMSPSP